MNLILRLYFLLPSDSRFGILTKITNRIVASLIKKTLDLFIPTYFDRTKNKHNYGLNFESREHKIIVSLTSFPGRIEDVWIPIECLFRQTYKPDRIIIWLSQSQFDHIVLPKKLVEQKNRGLEIRFVEDDLKSHKKYLYAFENIENDYVITVDDDIYYDNRLIENLIILKQAFPDCVATNRAHKIKFSASGKILPYSKWGHNVTEIEPSYLTVQTGGFGTLYEKGDFDVAFSNEKLIKQLIPHADDLWLKIQTIIASKKVVTNNLYNKDPITVKHSQLEKLVNVNVIDGGNDVQFHNVLNYFNLGQLESYRAESV